MGFAANSLLAPPSPGYDCAEGFARVVCKLCAFVLLAVYAYWRPLDLRQLAVCLTVVIAPGVCAQIMGCDLPPLLAYCLSGVADCLSVVAVGMTVYLMPSRGIRSGVTLGFAMSVFLLISLRSFSGASDAELRSVLAAAYLAVLLAVAFGVGKRQEFSPACATVGKYGGAGRFFVLILTQRGSLLLMFLVSTLFSFVLGIFSGYAQLEGVREGLTDGVLYVALAVLVALLLFALWRPDSRWFYSVLTALMLVCVVILLVVLLYPPSIDALAGSFRVMSLLVAVCVCTYTIEFSKEQGVTPAFTSVTLPFLENVLHDFGVSVNTLYYHLAPAGIYDLSRITAASLSCIAIASLVLLVLMTSRYESLKFALGSDAAADDRELPAQPEEPAEIVDVEQTLSSRYGLTKREAEVTVLFASGRSARHISEQDMVSESTVKTHLKHAYAKLAIHSRQELIDLIGTLR